MINPYILLNPGPVNLHPEVRRAATSIDLCHRQKEFIDILVGVKNKILTVSNKKNSNVSILHGSGDLSVESAVFSLIRGNVLVINNGHYCQRIINYLKFLPDVSVFSMDLFMGEYPCLDIIDSYLRRNVYDWVIVVHHETSTGLLNPLSEICDLIEGRKTKIMVDAVSSFGGHNVDGRANIICTNSNKCLESIPGAAIIIWDKDLEINENIPPYFNLYEYIENKMPYTPNVNAILALNVALDIYKSEDRFERYRNLSSHVREIGSKYFKLLLDSNYSNVLTSFLINDRDFKDIYKKARDGGFILYDGKLSNQFRVANMGVSISENKIRYLFDCIGK